MKHDERGRLLNDILDGEEVSEFRQASLAQTLDAIRCGKRRRRALQLTALAVLPILVVVVLAVRWSPSSAVNQPISNFRPETPSTAPVEQAAIKIISDEELFALFPGRSLALVGQPGRQQLVFLDDTTSN